jgi:Neprosin
MRTHGFVCGEAMGCVALFVAGCTIYIGPGGGGTGEDAVLPVPKDDDGGAEPALDSAQQARKDETERYVANVIYHGAKVTQALRLPSGDILDGLDRSTLPALPYALPTLPFTPQELTLPPEVQLAVHDVDQIPELSALVNQAAVFQRPTFWPYILGETDATSVTDYLARYTVEGAPDKGNRLYAGLRSLDARRGVSGFMNQFRPEVADGSFSLMEFAVGCPAGNPQEVVGVVLSVDKANFFGAKYRPLTDGELRLHVEYAHVQNGEVHYMWDGMDGAFVANPSRRVRPGQIVAASVLRGAQVEHLLAIFQAPTGDWWIMYNQELLGYYPAKLFTMLNGGACESAFYGEVYNPNPDPNRPNPNNPNEKGGPVKTEMGSGRFSWEGRPNTAYIRNPKDYDASWFGVDPQDLRFMQPVVESCYTRSKLETDPASGDRVFTLGGPGGKDPGCKWPYP